MLFLIYEYPYIYLKGHLCKKIKDMTLIDFISKFPNEEHCKQKFKEFRDQVGVVCSKYDGTDHY